MTRWLLYRFLPYFLILGLLISVGLLIGTELGLQVIWRQIAPRLPAELSIQAVHGRLFHKISVEGLEYRQGERHVRLQRAWLSWRPQALFSGRVEISEVVLADGEVVWPAADEPPPEAQDQAPPAELPALPDILLDKLSLRLLSFSDGTNPPLVIEAANLSAKVQSQNLELRLKKLRLRDWGEWQLSVTGKIEPTSLNIAELRVRGLEDPALELDAHARCDWPTLDCEVQADWAELRWPLFEPRWFSPSGQASLSRAGVAMKLNLQTRLAGEKLPDSQLTATLASADADTQHLGALWQSDQGEVRLVATGNLEQIDGQLQLQDLDLGYWHAQTPSSITGQGRFAWRQAGQVELSELKLTGQVRGEDLALDARGSGDARSWNLDHLTLSHGQTRLQAQLARSDRWKGRVSLNAPKLAELAPDLAGSLGLKVQLSGQSALPDLSWRLQGRDLALVDKSLAKLEFNGQFSQQTVQWTLQADSADLPGVHLQKLSLRSQGDVQSLQHELALRSSVLDLDLKADSRWDRDQQRLDLQVKQGELALVDSPRWTLDGPSPLQASAAHVELARQCWRSQEAKSCLDLHWQQQELGANWQLDGYDVKRLNRYLPGIARVQGLSAVSVNIPRAPLDELQAQLALTTEAIELSRGINGESETVLEFAPGQLQANWRDDQLQSDWQFPLPEQPGLSGRMSLSADQQLDGELLLGLDQLQWLSALVPEVLDAQGRIAGQLRVTGPLERPQLDGDLQLADGRVQLDTPDIVLDPLRIELRGNDNHSLKMALHAGSGDGAIDLNGFFSWEHAKPRLQATIRGENFLAANSREVRVTASPQLDLAMLGHQLEVKGKLKIPKARIQPRSLGNGDKAKAPSADQVILGEEPAAPRMRVSSEVVLELGDDVRFSGFGLDTELAGKLSTRLRPAKPATGVGELKLVKGRYKAYGQDLQIERGRLIFSGGPLSQPGLDIRAYRQASSEIRAGVQVRGPLRAPELSLWSNPSMRETDQLSYLVLGRPAQSSSEQDQTALSNAALALGLKGGQFLAGRFKGKLGLDEVSIGSQPGAQSEQAALVLGKYLNPDLYISYGIGLFEPVYTFKLRYQLHKRWVLQTESGLESGGDIFYTIER